MESRDVFISYAEQDGATARTLAAELRTLKISTWMYEEDGVAGISYLTQISAAIQSCRAFVLIASPMSVNAHQVIREVEQAHEREKAIMPVRVGLSHEQFLGSNPILRMACGTAVTLTAALDKLPEVAKRIAAALSFSELQTQPTQRRAPGKKAVEVPSTAKAVPAKTPAASGSHKQPVVAPRPRVSEPSIERTEPPTEVPVVQFGVSAQRPWRSIWIGVAGQTIWAGAVAFDLVWVQMHLQILYESVYLSYVLAVLLPVVVLICGLGLARFLIKIRRSRDAGTIRGGPNLLLVITAVFIAATHSFLFATDFEYNSIRTGWIVLPGLSPYFIIFNAVCLALVWNGLRKLGGSKNIIFG